VKGEPRTHHLHLNEVTSADWQQQIAFRDYLRAHPDVARDYAAVKLRLARQFPTDRLAYTENKSGFIFNVLRKAMPALIPAPGEPLRVRMFKTNNQCYRWWQTTVESVDDEKLTTFEPPGNLIHDLKGDWITQSAIRACYWFDRPYVLLEVYHPDGMLGELYIHISSPAVAKATELWVMDHELDVVKAPDQPPRIVDEEEFAAASITYGYSLEFQAFCRQVAQEALVLADTWVVRGWHNK
jgi:protein associated with RNAse G/E